MLILQYALVLMVVALTITLLVMPFVLLCKIAFVKGRTSAFKETHEMLSESSYTTLLKKEATKEYEK